MINVLIIAIIVLVVALCIRSLVNDRKAGRSSCGGNCASCGACCHGNKPPVQQGKSFPSDVHSAKAKL